MQFAGAPPCTGCGKSVYHAEQVFGPAKKIYHKPCLKCQQCSKRLDPGGLVEHDNIPYCKYCHIQLFGTRDLRHGNLNASPASTPSRTPARRPLPQTPLSPSGTPSRTLGDTGDYYSPARMSPSLPRSPDLHYSLSREATQPITRPTITPFGARTENLGSPRRNDSPRAKIETKISVMGEEYCWGCEKRVYAAEQVYALGHKWHRGCLRCEWCKSTVAPGNVSDRRGAPICKHCYAKEFGPGGTMGRLAAV